MTKTDLNKEVQTEMILLTALIKADPIQGDRLKSDADMFSY